MQILKNILRTENQIRLAVVFVLFFLSSVKTFAQTEVAVVSVENNTTVVSISATIATSDSDIDFMNWFMGSKQAQSSSSSSTNSSMSTKKQLINSGGVTNRVLYKTLVKKVISIDNALV